MRKQNPNLRWNKCCFHPFESVWSVLHKLSHWNSLTPDDLVNLLWEPTKYQARPPKNQGASDWRPYSMRRLSTVLKVPSAQLVLAETSPFRFEVGEWKIENPTGTEETLRFCPQCIEQGFHSALFQMLWIERCPIHDEKIANVCPSCSSNVPYECNWETLSFAYGCTECGHALWPSRDKIPGARTVGDHDLARLSEWFFGGKNFNFGIAQDRALFCLLPTPLACGLSSNSQLFIPSMLLQASGATPAELSPYARTPHYIYTTWDIDHERGLYADPTTLSSGYHPQYRTLLPPNLKPTWRTKVKSNWIDGPAKSFNTFVDETKYIFDGFRKFLIEELLSAHSDCFGQEIDLVSARTGGPVKSCPWVVAVERWEEHWRSYRRRGATDWGFANWSIRARHRQRKYCGATIWASDACEAFGREFNRELSWEDTTNFKSADNYETWMATKKPDFYLGRDQVLCLHLLAMIRRFLNLQLIKTFASTCSELNLLEETDASPIQHCDDMFFTITFGRDDERYRPLVHLWHQDWMRLLRNSSQLGCDGAWVSRRLLMPPSKSLSDLVMRQ